MIESHIRRAMSRIRLLALDSDGVLTDGGVYMSDDGRHMRRFDIKDGLGIKRVQEYGIEVAIISASSVDVVVHRAKQLGIEHVHVGVKDKLEVLTEVCNKVGIGLAQAAFVGDDLTDLPVIKQVSVSAAPADAVAQVREAVNVVLTQNGGYGAVREFCELLIASRGM